MAHDRQLANQSNEDQTPQTLARSSLDVLADWWALYMQIYRDDPTVELAQVYRETLQNFRPEILHKAFLRAVKTCKFRPSPAEVLAAVEIEMEQNPTQRKPIPTDCEHCRGTGWKQVTPDGKFGLCRHT